VNFSDCDLNWVPNAEFKRLDLPEFKGPTIQTTITFSYFVNLTTSLSIDPLNSKFSPSISSKLSPFLI
jgi:hypothetical protein